MTKKQNSPNVMWSTGTLPDCSHATWTSSWTTRNKVHETSESNRLPSAVFHLQKSHTQQQQRKLTRWSWTNNQLIYLIKPKNNNLRISHNAYYILVQQLSMNSYLIVKNMYLLCEWVGKRPMLLRTERIFPCRRTLFSLMWLLNISHNCLSRTTKEYTQKYIRFVILLTETLHIL